MYPIHHGLVGNSMLDVATGERYSWEMQKRLQMRNGTGGTPIWNLAEKNKMISACYYWPGSEAPINGILPLIRTNILKNRLLIFVFNKW
ncbi:Type I phosphodiesterase / nucleotide pyrophosphatase [Algoriella xinjiangensis]|uniref:alkaline phosphatase family protein n=1 Tax=Algoriella xinjiangensis TaxID=684065 RepID=UPI000F9CD60B|nr:alkaline phosphatase family protein [Algoriella xinjiangensis]VDH16472.1 Type I phosphodiesterase / nucleotide pyrophosphatase [Algoriella xinjiangensis]